MKSRTYEIDMCNGPLLPKLLLFSLPLVASGILQLLFNAVDVAVVGRFTGSQALAAVGSTTSLINIFITLFIGISLGANVLTGKTFATGDHDHVSKVVHTAITFAILAGIVTLVAGILAARPALTAMATPDDVIDQAVLYMRLYFLSMPFFMLYNFGAAILRAVGDTRRPLLYLIIAGVSNVALNLILVIVFHLGVAGVAIGTLVAQAISCALVLRCLTTVQTSYRLDFQKLHIDKSILFQMLRIGAPAGIQSMTINLSNALIQSTVNSFGTAVIAGNTAANNINGFLYMAVNAVTQAGLSFTSQNSAVGNYKRMTKILIECTILQIIIGTGLGFLCFFFGKPLLHIYTTDPQVVSYGMINIMIICLPYAICGIMDMLPGCVRGMGFSTAPMIIAIVGVVLFRFFWIFIVFPNSPTLEMLYISYPVSWILSTCMHFICYVVVRHKLQKKSVVIVS